MIAARGEQSVLTAQDAQSLEHSNHHVNAITAE